MGEAAGGEAFRRRRIGTVPRAATRCSAKSSCTSAGVSRLGAEGCCSVAYQEDVAVGPGPAKPSERRQSPIRAEAIPSDPKSLMKYCSQVLTTARVLLGWNPCSKGNGFVRLGYAECQDISFEPRFAEHQLDRHPSFADDLVRLDVDLRGASPRVRPGRESTR